MGRELVIQAIKKGNTEPLFEDWVCGRNEATSYIANYFYSKWGGKNYGELTDEDYNLDFNIKDKTLTQIEERLEEIREEDYKEEQKEEECVADLREARRHANYEDFAKFSQDLEDLQNDLDNFFSTADRILNMIDKAKKRIKEKEVQPEEDPSTYVVRFILSE